MNKRNTLILVGLLLCASVLAEEYKVISFHISDVNTSTTSKTHVVKGVTGVPVAFSYISTVTATGMVVNLDTVAGYGLSTVVATNLYGILTTNISANAAISGTVYLGNDRVVMSAYSSQETGTEVVGRLLILQ